eukprot:COSAG06_NODE_24280_length_667_cov_1.075704_2_plen_65_part_01
MLGIRNLLLLRWDKIASGELVRSTWVAAETLKENRNMLQSSTTYSGHHRRGLSSLSLRGSQYRMK